MRSNISRPLVVFGCVCIFLILMCAFFIDASYAAALTSGTTTKKEQTIKLNVEKKGALVIAVSDNNSWVYAQVQEKGSNKISAAVNGDNVLAPLGQKKMFSVPVKKTGTYYLYIHGTNSGAKYNVWTIKRGGSLKNDTPATRTSYGDNKTVIWYTFKVSGNGSLRVTVRDSSYRYPGYSKVRLKKNDKLVSEEEHLIRGLGYSTVYGVSKGTYKIGVRSSSEIYKITAKFNKMNTPKPGKDKSSAYVIKAGKKTYGVIEPGNTSVRWYKMKLPKKSKSGEKKTITIKAFNNNLYLDGGISFRLRYKKNVDGELKTVTNTYVLNNCTKTIKLGLFKNKVRNVYIEAVSAGGANGAYQLSWN